MRISIVVLTSGGLSGGFRKYLDRVVPRLRTHSEISALDVFVPSQLAHSFQDARSWSQRDRLGYRTLRDEVLARRPDVVFIPTARYVQFGDVPVVSMVRNMEPLLIPFEGNSPTTGFKNVGRAMLARWSCFRSARVIAVSQHVRDHLVGRWRVPAGRIAVVAHGVDPAEFAPTPPASISLVPGSFVFTAGSIRPARGLDDLLAASAHPEFPSQARIVIAGSPDQDTKRYAAALKRRFQGNRVSWAGRLSGEEMSWCFAHARVFVMTSRAEACPNTVLEALARGALSVSTDTAPMPEFYRLSAVYYSAGNACALARAIARAWNLSAPEREVMAERARQRAAEFSWDKTADATVRELKAALAP